MSRITLPLLATVACLASACSRKVEERGQAATAERPASAGAQSTEGESCSATRDCEAPLRCVAQSCWRAAGSLLAQYWEAAGEEAITRGDAKLANERFERALSELEAAKESPSTRLICAQAQASLKLAGVTREKTGLERAARALHRCALAASAGTGERWGALIELARLEQQGLDPAVLGKQALSDAYLTKAPDRPEASALKLALEPPADAKDKTFIRFLEFLKADRVRAALLPCYEPYWAETQKPELVGSFKFKLKYYEAEDEEDDRESMEIETAPGPWDPPGLTKAAACIRDVLLPLGNEFAKGVMGSRWLHPMTIRLTP